jgi:hypothetical protein
VLSNQHFKFTTNICVVQAPLLPLALTILEKRSASLPEYEHPEGKEASSKVDRRTIFLCLYAVITTITLFRDDSLRGFTLKLCWLFAQIVFYWALSHRVSQLNGIKFDDMVEVWHTATELADWMALITIPLTILWWHHGSSFPHIGLFGFLKACRWIAVLVLVRKGSSSYEYETRIYL